MSEDYRRRVGLVFEAARLVRGKRQNEVGKQSSVSTIESGHTGSLDGLLAVSGALEIELWVILRIVAALPERCCENPATRIKALGAAIGHLEEHLRDAQQ